MKLRRLLIVVALLAVGALGLYAAYLNHIVTTQFEGRRWTLPAQVYAAPLELYAGLGLSGTELEAELRRLQYRQTDDLRRPGTYRKSATRLDVALRAALALTIFCSAMIFSTRSRRFRARSAWRRGS